MGSRIGATTTQIQQEKENFNRQELLPVQFLPCILQAGIAELNNEQGNQGLSELGQILNPK